MKLSDPLRSRGLSALFAFSILGLGSLHAQTEAEDFEDGSISPFSLEISSGNLSEIITPAGFPARAGTKVHHIKWYADNYNNDRPSRSVEGNSATRTRITGEGWYGFSFYCPESFPAPGKEVVLGQLHAWHALQTTPNITVTVFVRKTGELVLEGAYGDGTGGKTVTVYTTLAPKLTKGGWHDVVLYVKYSNNNTGILKVWLDGAPETAPTASFTGINLGNGAWTGNTMTYGTYIKWGPYCWDNANYTPGESREIYYDEIAYQTGNPAGSFNLVKPSGYGTGYASPTASAVADAAVVVETYDLLATGSSPAGWDRTYGASTGLTVREVPGVSDKSMQFYDGTATAHIEAYKILTAQTGRVRAIWSFMQTGQAEGHFMALQSGAVSAIELSTAGGNLVYRDGAGVNQVVQAIPANIWYDVEVEINPSTFKADVYVDGVRKLTGASYRNPATSVDRIRFGTSDASASYHYYVNDVVVSQAPAVLVETYDSLASPSSPAGWVRTYASSTGLTVRDVPSVADKSMQFYDGNATARIEAYRTFAPQQGRISAKWSFMQTGQAEGHSMALLSGGLPAIELYTIGGNLVYRNGSGVDQIVQAIPANTWYDAEVIVNPGTFTADVYVGGIRKLTRVAYRNATTSIDRIRFGTGDASASYHYYVDDVAITQAPPVFAETFDAMSAPSDPQLVSGWFRAYGDMIGVTVRGAPSATDHSIEFYDASATLASEAYHLFVPQTSTFAASWSFKQNQASEGHYMGLASGSTTAVKIFTSNGNLYYQRAGSTVSMQAVPAGVWYDVKVVAHPGSSQAEVYVNNILRLSTQLMLNGVTSVDRVVFGTGTAASQNYYINNISVNDYEAPPMAPLAANIPRRPIVLKLDDLSSSGGIPSLWLRVSDFAKARNIKFSAGLIADSLNTTNTSYLNYIKDLRNGGYAEIWFHGYDHGMTEFVGTSYAVQKSRFTSSQALAATKLGFPFTAFGAPGNAFDATTVQVMSEDADMRAWIYGDPLQPGGKVVLERDSLVNIEQPTFVPNPERFVGGYTSDYAAHPYFVIQGHPGNWTEARWAEFVRLIDWLQANNFTFTTPTELADSL
ncbi:MAG: heparin lyase I family protein [Opitutaceae bacterium]|jgi:hypothetical protein